MVGLRSGHCGGRCGCAVRCTKKASWQAPETRNGTCPQPSALLATKGHGSIVTGRCSATILCSHPRAMEVESAASARAEIETFYHQRIPSIHRGSVRANAQAKKEALAESSRSASVAMVLTDRVNLAPVDSSRGFESGSHPHVSSQVRAAHIVVVNMYGCGISERVGAFAVVFFSFFCIDLRP